MSRGFSLKRNESRAGVTFVAPAIVLLVAFTVIPTILAAKISLSNFPLLAPNRQVFIGLRNYVTAITDQVVHRAFLNTAYYAIWVIVLQTAVGLGLALLVARPIRGVAVFRVAYYTPVVISMVVACVVWRVMFDSENGLFDAVLVSLHLPSQPFLTSTRQALPSLAVMLTWKWVGFSMLVFMAGLNAVPTELYEAGTVDGASSFQRFWFITLPQIRQPALYVVVVNTVNALQLFTPVYVITQGGPEHSTLTVVYRIFQEAFVFDQMGYAASIAILYSVVMVCLAVLQFQILKRGAD